MEQGNWRSYEIIINNTINFMSDEEIKEETEQESTETTGTESTESQSDETESTPESEAVI